MRNIVYLFIIFIVMLFVYTEAQTNKFKLSFNNDPDIKLMQEINNAWATLNPGKASQYYDKSPDNIFYDSYPFKYRGWTSYSDGAKEVLKGLASMKYTVGRDATIKITGEIAFGTATLHMITVDKAGNKDMIDLRWTVIWEKKKDSWLIVHEHLSVPAINSN